MDSLTEIAKRYATDKARHTHYLVNYERFLGSLRDRPVNVLELGVKDGGSLLMWRDYFPQGSIVGLDLAPAPFDGPVDRVRTYVGAQEDIALLDIIASETAPDGFDIIIDDCAHIGVLARATFWYLFDHHLKPGGIYVIEDWGTGYWPSWPDGAPYRPARERNRTRALRLTIALSRIRKALAVAKLPGLPRVVGAMKGFIARRQFASHTYGMVGFVKELVDEAGYSDITFPDLGSGDPRPSKFRDLAISTGHVFVTKA